MSDDHLHQLGGVVTLDDVQAGHSVKTLLGCGQVCRLSHH